MKRLSQSPLFWAARLIVVLVFLAALLMQAVFWAVTDTMPSYRDSVGNANHTEKITGLHLVRESAARDDNMIIFGSSELRTTEISTHPSNFFAGKRDGFQVNLVGRGSTQSIIHAISIAASGDSLTGKKVVLITSPQSFVPEGIAPDLFMANFSEQQYLELLRDDSLSNEVKEYISSRVAELFDRYEEMANAVPADTAIRYTAEHHAGPTLVTTLRDAAMTPYYSFSRYLLNLRDLTSSAALIRSVEEGPVPVSPQSEIDWTREEAAALDAAIAMTGNSNFGMLDDYYSTYIGTRLSRQKDQDKDLDYSESEEYGDLRILFEICRQKGVEPLFVHVPLHGEWSDYTGFSADRRAAYYENVRGITEEYGIRLLDLTGYEYEEYFLCDVMHLGWKGWLAVDRALIDYYHGG